MLTSHLLHEWRKSVIAFNSAWSRATLQMLLCLHLVWAGAFREQTEIIILNELLKWDGIVFRDLAQLARTTSRFVMYTLYTSTKKLPMPLLFPWSHADVPLPSWSDAYSGRIQQSGSCRRQHLHVGTAGGASMGAATAAVSARSCRRVGLETDDLSDPLGDFTEWWTDKKFPSPRQGE